MLAINGGSIMRQVGQGIRSAISNESVISTIGVAYSLEGGSSYEEQVSMYFFKSLTMKNCVGEDAGYMKLVRSGGIQCNECDFYMNEKWTREDALVEMWDGPSQKESVYNKAYLLTRITEGINPIAPIMVIQSQYTGQKFNFTLGNESFQASPKTRPDMLWFKFCRFYHLQGGLSGGFHVDQSHVYLSNPDASLNRRLLESVDEDDH